MTVSREVALDDFPFDAAAFPDFPDFFDFDSFGSFSSFVFADFFFEAIFDLTTLLLPLTSFASSSIKFSQSSSSEDSSNSAAYSLWSGDS